MTKRELIDRNELPNPNCDNSWEFEQFVDDVMHNAEVFTEHEIVKPYLEKLRKEMESQRDYLLRLNKKDNPTAKDIAYGVNWCINTINDII